MVHGAKHVQTTQDTQTTVSKKTEMDKGKKAKAKASCQNEVNRPEQSTHNNNMTII